MPVIKTLKRRYLRKKQQKKDVAVKKEYARYRNTYLGTDQPVAKMQSYAQWHQDKYGKYAKPKLASKRVAVKKPSKTTTRTSAVERGLKRAAVKKRKIKRLRGQ